MVDVLEAGRGNILSLLSNNSESLTFSQLGGSGGLHFLGPIRGVLPMGPNGVPAFDTLHPSPFSNEKTVAGMLSYNYTLEHQGLASNIKCIYDTQSPVRFGQADPSGAPYVLQYNGTCDSLGAADVLTDVRTVLSVNSNNTLGYWACQSRPVAGQMPSYTIYLRGRNNYAQSVGNMTCTVSPIQPAIFEATYTSYHDIFALTKPIATSQQLNPQLTGYALVGLAGVIHQSQNWQANLVIESIITFGVKSFKLQPYEQNETYLRLYEAMIQGILEYEVTYIRLIYSTVQDRPASCSRAVNGTVSYEVIGWSGVVEEIGLLMPMTIFLLAGLIIIGMAMYKARKNTHDHDEDVAPELAAQVKYHYRDAFKNAFDRFVERDKEEREEAGEENPASEAVAALPELPLNIAGASEAGKQ